MKARFDQVKVMYNGKWWLPTEMAQEIARLEAENEALREAHKRNLRQRTEYAELGHRCSWRSAYEAVVQRSKAALQEQGE